MDQGLFSSLMSMIQSHPAWLIAMAFVFALLESLAIVGIFVPGIVLLFIVGAVVGLDGPLFLACWIAAAGGALIGDGISYWLGYRYSDHIPRIWPLSRRPDMLAAGQTLFARHGGKGVFIGRFIGPIRPVVPLLSGMMALKPTVFLFFAIPACLLWAPLYLLPGMLFGASLELAAEFAGRLAIVLLVLVLGIWFVVWLTRVIYEFTARRSGWWLKGLIRWGSEHPLFGRLVGPLFEPGGREVISVALLGLLLVICLAVLLVLLVVTPFAGPTLDLERHLSGWAVSLRNHFADPLFVALALAGSIPVMILLAGVLTLVLVAVGRTNAAWHWLVAIVGGWLLAELLNALTGLVIARPDYMPSLGEVPHRAFSLVVVVLGFFAVMLAKDLSARRRKWPYLATSALLGLIGFAHYYLSLASPLGLLAALALGLGWTALVGIGYRQRAVPGQHPVRMAMLFYGLAVAVAVAQVRAGYDQLMDATRLAQPERELNLSYWVEDGWRTLPERLTRFGRYEWARFDFQVAADLTRVEHALAEASWQRVGQPGLRSVGAMFLGQASAERLPHLSRDFVGRPDQLIMRRVGENGDVAVVRLWSSGARIHDPSAPIWLGQARKVRLVSVMGVSRWQEVDGGPELALERLHEALIEGWQVEVRDGFRLYADESLFIVESIMSSSASSR
jgi:membrane protein DedA with SNARE-associated domain